MMAEPLISVAYLRGMHRDRLEDAYGSHCTVSGQDLGRDVNAPYSRGLYPRRRYDSMKAAEMKEPRQSAQSVAEAIAYAPKKR